MAQYECCIEKNFLRNFGCSTACQLRVMGEKGVDFDEKSAIKNKKDLGCAKFTVHQEKCTVSIKIVTQKSWKFAPRVRNFVFIATYFDFNY